MIELLYGNRQRFRWRHPDINVLGRTDAALPVRRAAYRLNDGAPVPFYVERKPQPGGPTYPWGMRTPAVLRLRDRPGYFNVEIPVDAPELRAGRNAVAIEIEGGDGGRERLDAEFSWDPSPVPLPLDLSDLSGCTGIQDVAQVVDGEFDLDPERGIIASRTPVGADILLLLGSPWSGGQEATYDVRFERPTGWCFLGLSDFFAGHLEQSPELGIKPGYCSAGLATLDNSGWPQVWLSWGDSLYDKDDSWVVKTEKRISLPLRPGVTYSVRHQVRMADGVNRGRFRIWRKGNPEPQVWAAQADNRDLDPKLPRITKASFGLFQYWGGRTEWSNIRVDRLPA